MDSFVRKITNMSLSGKLIGIASDHGGFEMKEFLKAKLVELGYKVNDYGTNGPESVDYPDYIHPIANDVNKGKLEKAVILCGSGNGAQMTANKYLYVRQRFAGMIHWQNWPDNIMMQTYWHYRGGL